MKNLPAHNKGFTLIEAIVSIVILAFAVGGPMALSAQSLRASREARLELEATHIAEEGVEIIHNIRDNSSATDPTLARTGWLTAIFGKCATGCIVDVTDHSAGVWGPNAIVMCPAGDCSTMGRIYYHPTSHLFRQSGTALGAPWEPTMFTRSMTITGVDDVANPLRQAILTATVTYQGYNGATRTISVRHDLYNWFPAL